MARPKNPELREFILRSIPKHAADVASFAAEKFRVTRASVNVYLRGLTDEGLIEAEGKTKARRYRLKRLDEYVGQFPITPDLQEDFIAREYVSPHLRGRLPQSVVEICEYGFAEMFNNVIDHSEGTTGYVTVARDYARIVLTVGDDGVGIFDKIAKACHLHDKREAILELSKGKFTTDSAKHTGEGIFFTSRMFDEFRIISSDLCYDRSGSGEDDEWLIEDREKGKEYKGTLVRMAIATDAKQTAKEIFERYVDDDDRFSKTHVPLSLAKYEGENLVSRSQARRLLTRVERFSEVILDFRGINEVGQAFADEIFRVWQREHPQVKLVPVGVTDEVGKMIRHALANAAERNRSKFPPTG